MTDCQNVCYVLKEDIDGMNHLKASVSVWTTSCNTNLYAFSTQLIRKIPTLTRSCLSTTWIGWYL